MSRAVEERVAIGGVPSSASSPSSSSSSAAATLSPMTSGKLNMSVSSTTSPHKKASPSDVIFGKPPGTDSASRAYESLNADISGNSSSTGGSGGIGEGNNGIGHLKETQDSTMGAEKSIAKESGGSANGSSSTSTGSDTRSQAASVLPAPPTSSTAAQTEAEVAGTGQDVKMLPMLFEDAEAEDIVVLVADMLSRLTTHNDLLPLHPTSLTRFHSRATPSISILSYLKRITKYTSLEKSCTLILLVYIDRVCQRVSGFTICSLTVHRFICAAVVCASKALCDSFSTNGHYARVGGISLIELNMLEKEFLNIIDWKLSCSGALLQHYYTSLVKSHQSFQLKGVTATSSPTMKTPFHEEELSESSTLHTSAIDVDMVSDGGRQESRAD